MSGEEEEVRDGVREGVEKLFIVGHRDHRGAKKSGMSENICYKKKHFDRDSLRLSRGDYVEECEKIWHLSNETKFIENGNCSRKREV